MSQGGLAGPLAPTIGAATGCPGSFPSVAPPRGSLLLGGANCAREGAQGPAPACREAKRSVNGLGNMVQIPFSSPAGPPRFVLEQPLGPKAPLEALRLQYEAFGARLNKKLRVPVEITKVQAGTVDAEWIELAGVTPQRVILYLHGGGFTLGSAESHRAVIIRLCQAAGARALSVSYRLAPEHPFPRALEDALIAFEWLLRQGVDPRGLVIAGDGAGGGLALSATMALRDNQATLPAALTCLSPWTDLALTGWSLLTNEEIDQGYDFKTLSVMARHYLKGHRPTDPLVSPLYGDFKRLPPLLIQCGASEMLRDDTTRLSAIAERAGADLSVEVYEDMPHAFHLQPKLAATPGALTRLGSFIRSRAVID